MAAGLGTRLRPFTDHFPKALVPVMGVPVAQYAVDRLLEAGVHEIVYNIHHHPKISQAGFESLDLGSAQLKVSDERALLLGSAGGLKNALPYFKGESFYWVNADIISSIDLLALAHKHRELVASSGVVMTLAVFPQAPSTGAYREIFIDPATGLVQGFSQDLRVGQPFFASAAVLESEALAYTPAGVPSEFVPQVLEPWVKAGRVGFHLTQGLWKDIGNPRLWLDAHRALIESMETGALPLRWRKRLGAVNQRLSNQVWCSREAFSRMSFQQRAKTMDWSGPCYFAGSSFVADFGPDSALYGAPPLGTSFQGGIGIESLWSQCVDVATGN